MLTRHPLESYSAYLDGHCLSDAEVSALRSWIAADERNAVEFVEFAALHAAVTERLRLDRLLDDLASHRTAGGISPSLLASAIREIELNSPRVLELPRPTAPSAEAPVSFTWPAAATFAALAATLLIAVWGFWQQGAEIPLPQVAVHEPAAPAPAPEAERKPPQVVARLATSFDAKWAGSAMARKQKLFAGESISLLSGVAQFDMKGGAVVVVEGPTEIKLSGPDALKLLQGKAAVRVAEAGKSFVIDTPTMQVIDLGTEFGVETLASGTAQVMVFDGTVAIGEASADETSETLIAASAHAPRLAAGYQVNVDANESVLSAASQPATLSNPRYFLRPDEIEVRLRALDGSIADRKLADFYGQQRIAGLLAYQPFDADSKGRKLTLGLGKEGLIAKGDMKFVKREAEKSAGIEVSGGEVFLPLDVSGAGPFARLGLLTNAGRIGQSGGELWISWTTRRIVAAPEDNGGSAGLSLMIGERETMDEPLIVGRASGASQEFILQSAWGGAAPPHGTVMSNFLDLDSATPGLQGLPVDDQEHRWLMKIQFNEGADHVSVWMDVDPESAEAIEPQATLDAVNVQFDRIRMAVNRDREVWRFSDLVIAENPQAIVRLSDPAEFNVDQ